MKFPRLLWILIALALLGAMIGYFISAERPFLLKPKAESAATKASSSEQVVFDFPTMFNEPLTVENLTFPNNAIKGELSLHFTSRQAYNAYLRLLNEAGMAPLGQIDELLALRIPESALSLGQPRDYGAQTGFSYLVKRPDLPNQIAPDSLGALSAYDASARAISGGAGEGDGSGVLVGILDSGIEAHAQFEDLYIVHIDLAGGGVGGSGAAHGTSVASIISGREGVAPGAELFVVRVLDDEGRGNSFHVAEGIIQAVDMGVKVINMSLGLYEDSLLLRQAVNYAAERGVLMVAAAGNDGYDRIPFPAAYPEVLAVTAVDSRGQQARFPNQSDLIDFAAPGVGILTADGLASTRAFSGTSAAASFVSGTLASLISGAHAVPPKQAVLLLKSLLNDAGAPGPDPVYGQGLVDWDRLRERNTEGILDVALADIYLPPDAQPGTTRSVEVTVQNRGTRWFRDADLEVLVDAKSAPVHFALGALGPGQTTTRKVLTSLPSLSAEDVLYLEARVVPEGMADDVRPGNNAKRVAFRPLP